MSLELMVFIMVPIATVIIGVILFYGMRRGKAEQKVKIAEETAKRMLEDAKKEAERARKEGILEAKDESLKLKAELERNNK